MRVLVLDVGSTSVKAGVYQTGAGRSRSKVRVAYPTLFQGPRVEISPQKLLHSVDAAGRAALAGKSVDAIAFCTFSSGVVVTDAAGDPRTPIIPHSDRRSTQVARELVQRTGKSWWLTRAGNLPYSGGIGASTLAWLNRFEPRLFRGPYRVGQVSSLVGRWLTGHWITDPSQAAFLGLWDIRSQAWSAELCRHVGVALDALPQVQWADAILGGLAARFARRWGLKPGTPVVGGCVDTSAGIIQSPLRAGQLTHSAGSTDVLAMTLRAPRPAEGILTRPVGVGRRYPPAWLAVRTIAASGSALQWARQTLFGELTPRAWQAQLQRSARAGAAEATCDAAFAGQRAALDQSAGATFRGVRLGTTRAHLLAAIVQGLVAESRRSYDLLHGIHRPRRAVYAMGGSGILGEVMHRAWPKHHVFHTLADDSLRGLGEMAARTLG